MYSGCPLPYIPSHGLAYPPAPPNFYPLIGYPPSDSLNSAPGPFSGPVPSAYSQNNLSLTRPMHFPPSMGYHSGQSHNPLPIFPYPQLKEEASTSIRLSGPGVNVMPESPSFLPQDCEKLSKSGKKPSMSSKSKKKSVQLENKKRKDFSELARARTEKLMSDGLNFKNNDNCEVQQQSTVPTVSEVENQQDSMKNTVLENALSKVKLQLMRSEKVISLLQAKQLTVENKKKSSELFSVQLVLSQSKS